MRVPVKKIGEWELDKSLQGVLINCQNFYVSVEILSRDIARQGAIDLKMFSQLKILKL